MRYSVVFYNVHYTCITICIRLLRRYSSWSRINNGFVRFSNYSEVPRSSNYKMIPLNHMKNPMCNHKGYNFTICDENNPTK